MRAHPRPTEAASRSPRQVCPASGNGSGAWSSSLPPVMRTPFLRRSYLLGAVAHVVSQELALFGGGGFQLRADEVAHRGNPLGYGRPRLAVPLLEEDGTTAFVIFAGDLERVRETLHPQLLQAPVGQ